MSLRLATVHENVRCALDCGGSTPPWNDAEDEDKSGRRLPITPRIKAKAASSRGCSAPVWDGAEEEDKSGRRLPITPRIKAKAASSRRSPRCNRG
jgi:hypothetical protein